ncbi:coiled-coil domain-containing protein 18-like [Dreissena polymorpha]|uniref:coiled-coil domain-containing protein 18-like n=1 Tax=Dreissena polymorpha TaxID=45954 RepID=UPI002263E6AC|nr:coiled-coil domain-containing protein 18-like [Dreissena polymorpha]
MTMASGSTAPKEDDMMKQFKSMYDFLKEIFQPSPQKGKSPPDVIAAIDSPQGGNFLKTVRFVTERMDSARPVNISSSAGQKFTRSPGAKRKEGGSSNIELQIASLNKAGPMTFIQKTHARDDKDLRKVVDDPLNQIKELETKISALQTELSELKQKHGKTVEEAETVAHGSAPTTKPGQSKIGIKRNPLTRAGTMPTNQETDARSTSSATGADKKSVNSPEESESHKKKEHDMEMTKEQFFKQKEENFVLNKRIEQAEQINRKLSEEINSLKQDVGKFEKGWNEAETQLKENNKAYTDLLDIRNQLLQNVSKLDSDVKKYQQDIENRDSTIMSLGNDLTSISKEHNDLKSRFSKLAGHMLTDQNPDIADLSDPNRAMKLSDKFGALYDDAWTDAFEDLTNKQKQKPNEAIQFLLESLKECWGMCKKEAETWMYSLQNVFAHPVQDIEAVSVSVVFEPNLRL